MVLGYGNHLTELEAYCLENGIEMVSIEVGNRLKDLLELTARSKDKTEVSGIVVWESNDIADNEIEYYYWYQEFVRRKINITVVNERYNEDFISIIRGMAEFGRNIAHTKGSVYARVKCEESGITFGATPYGYMKVGDSYKIVPREAEAIRLAFKLRDAGVPWGEVVEKINKAGYLTKKGTEINRSAVRVWIKNRKVYEGYRKSGEEWVKASYEPILK